MFAVNTESCCKLIYNDAQVTRKRNVNTQVMDMRKNYNQVTFTHGVNAALDTSCTSPGAGERSNQWRSWQLSCSEEISTSHSPCLSFCFNDCLPCLQVIPSASEEQLLLVELVRSVSAMRTETVMQTVKEVLKQPPAIAKDKVGLYLLWNCFMISSLSYFHHH